MNFLLIQKTLDTAPMTGAGKSEQQVNTTDWIVAPVQTDRQTHTHESRLLQKLSEGWKEVDRTQSPLEECSK